jgi:hypothetical protein
MVSVTRQSLIVFFKDLKATRRENRSAQRLLQQEKYRMQMIINSGAAVDSSAWNNSTKNDGASS